MTNTEQQKTQLLKKQVIGFKTVENIGFEPMTPTLPA